MEESLRDKLVADQADKEGKLSSEIVEDNSTAYEAAPSSTAQIATMKDSTINSLASPEQMPSMTDAPIPLGVESMGPAIDDELQAKKAASLKPELMYNNSSPDVNIALLHNDNSCCNKKSARGALETIETDSSCPCLLMTLRQSC